MRRKFVEAELHCPAPCGEVLDLIGQLYAVERGCPTIEASLSDEGRVEALAMRATARREQAAPIAGAIHAWAQRQRALPEGSLGKAIAYMLGLWRGLTRFLDDPRIALDNNATERALRGMVLGRKNHYGSRSQRGTEVAALFYSRIESAKLCGVEPVTELRKRRNSELVACGILDMDYGEGRGAKGTSARALETSPEGISPLWTGLPGACAAHRRPPAHRARQVSRQFLDAIEFPAPPDDHRQSPRPTCSPPRTPRCGTPAPSPSHTRS